MSVDYELTRLLDQNCRRVADDIFKCIFVNENNRIPIQISLKFVPNDLINNKPALTQIMARPQKAKRLINWTSDGFDYWRILASLGLNRLLKEALP